MMNQRVVVTGMGALTPIGLSVKSYWQNLLLGTSGAEPITHFDSTHFKTKFACELKSFDAQQHFDRKEIKKYDKYTQYALVACREAIQDAGLLQLNQHTLSRTGVIWGTGIGGLQSFQDEIIDFANAKEVPKFNPFFIIKMISNIAAGQISIKYGLQGPNFATVSACASSSNAVIDAYHLIKLGQADIMVSGGSEASITKAGIAGFNAMRALSLRNEDPRTASRPFDKYRDGFVMGEGAGAIILESYEHAKKRDAKIYAELIGIGMSADAYHMTTPHPTGAGIKTVMQNALRNANIPHYAIDYINVHGTSTPLGDMAELQAIQQVFGDHAYQLNISATKSMTGHLLGASGVVEAIASILSIKNQLIPPTINFTTKDDALDICLNLTLHQAQKRPVHKVLSNSFGFGGQNTSLIFSSIT